MAGITQITDRVAFYKMLGEDAQIKHRMPGKQIENVLSERAMTTNRAVRTILELSAVLYLGPLIMKECDRLESLSTDEREKIGLQAMQKNDIARAWEWLYLSTSPNTMPDSYHFPKKNQKGVAGKLSHKACDQILNGFDARARVVPYLMAARATIDESKLISHLRGTLDSTLSGSQEEAPSPSQKTLKELDENKTK